LSIGSHVFDWTIDRVFFASWELSEINDALIDVRLTLVKHTRFLELVFVFNGWVEVVCDRCLEPLKLDLASEAKMIVKFGEHESDSDQDDVITLPYDEDRLNVAQYLYEYAHLYLPIRRIHLDDANGKSGCNEEMLLKLNQYLIEN